MLCLFSVRVSGYGEFLICIMLNVALVARSLSQAPHNAVTIVLVHLFSSWVMAMSTDLIELMANFAKGESRNEGFRDRALIALEKLEITEIAHVQGSFESFDGQLEKLQVRIVSGTFECAGFVYVVGFWRDVQLPGCVLAHALQTRGCGSGWSCIAGVRLLDGIGLCGCCVCVVRINTRTCPMQTFRLAWSFSSAPSASRRR